MSVRFLGPDTDAYVSSVQRHAAEFEEKTGIELELEIVPSDLYFSNKIHHLLDGEHAADVYMSGPVLVWEHQAAGFVRPLDEFLTQASDEYEPEDFFDRLLDANRWSGVFGEPLGDGPLLEIPVNCESYNLAYLPSVLEEAGVDVPTTWAEYSRPRARSSQVQAAASAASASAGPVRGTRCTPALRRSCGRTAPATSLDGRCAIASSASIRATTDFLEALRDAGPGDWPEQRWYELALDFARGEYGLIVDSDHYVAYSRIRRIPSGSARSRTRCRRRATRERRPNLWTWSLVMNTRARDGDDAWRFIEWASSKDFLRRSVYEGNMNPTRSSIWDDEQFRAHTSSWGAF